MRAKEEILSQTGTSELVVDGSRADILSAAAHCFSERGYAASSIDDVARSLGATKGRIYHHFSSKGDLFAQVFRTGMDMNFEAIKSFRNQPGRAISVWRAMAEVHVRQMVTTRHFQRVVWEGVEMHLRGSTTPEQRSVYNELVEYRTEYSKMFRSVIERARQEGDMHFENASIANQVMFIAMNSPIFWYSPRSGETDDDLERIVRQVVDFAQGGLGARLERT